MHYTFVTCSHSLNLFHFHTQPFLNSVTLVFLHQNALSELHNFYENQHRCQVRWVSSIVMKASTRNTLADGYRTTTLQQRKASDESISTTPSSSQQLSLGPFPYSLHRFRTLLSGCLLAYTSLSRTSIRNVKLWAEALGARVHETFTERTTHLIAAKAMSDKYRVRKQSIEHIGLISRWKIALISY